MALQLNAYVRDLNHAYSSLSSHWCYSFHDVDADVMVISNGRMWDYNSTSKSQPPPPPQMPREFVSMEMNEWVSARHQKGVTSKWKQ